MKYIYFFHFDRFPWTSRKNHQRCRRAQYLSCIGRRLQSPLYVSTHNRPCMHSNRTASIYVFTKLTFKRKSYGTKWEKRKILTEVAIVLLGNRSNM